MTLHDNRFNDDDRLYLQMMQENIARMAGNSANCKTWAVTLAAGIMAIGVGIQQLNVWLIISLLPLFALWWLDAYYLHLERGMRNRQRAFLNLFDAPSLDVEAYRKALFNFTVLNVDEAKDGFVKTRHEWRSESVWRFYGVLVFVVIVLTIFLNCCVIADFLARIVCRC